MTFNQVLESLSADFAKLPFGERVEQINKIVGPPVATQNTSYPSGGGSRYAWWIVESTDHNGGAFFMRLEVGGYDPITGSTFSRAPWLTRPLEPSELAAGKKLYA